MFKVGDFARLAQVSSRLLRYYDKLGLLRPLHTDQNTGYRYYATEQLPRLYRILALKDLGLSLDQISYLLDEAVTNEEIRGILLLKQAELEQHLKDEKARLTRVSTRLSLLEALTTTTDVEIVLKHVEAAPVLTVRRALQRGETPKTLIREGAAVLRAHGLLQYVQAYQCLYYWRYLMLCHPAVKPRRQLVEAVYVIQPSKITSMPRVGNQRMKAYIMPAFDLVATSVHIGGDNTRHLTFQAMWRWMDEHQFRLAAPPREIYLKRGTADRPEDNITEVQFPLMKLNEDMVSDAGG